MLQGGGDKPLIYLDNAATSWPKPPSVAEAMIRCLNEAAANPGRGSHAMAVKASRVLFEARKKLARLFNIANPNDIAFTLNTTHALNLAIQGWLRPGDHVITTSVEHNSIRRPLEAMRRTRGVDITYIPADSEGQIDLNRVEAAIRDRTTLIAVTHASNLLGSVLPVRELGALARAKGAKLLVDAAQSAGAMPIDVEAMNIDMLAFPGHKGLMGPQGTGGLYVHPDIDLEPLMYGGTGSHSELADQPAVRPDRYEAGTMNTVGIAGLSAGVQFVLDETVEKIGNKEKHLTDKLLRGLLNIPGVRVLGPAPGKPRAAVVSFVLEGADPSETAFILDQHYGIAVRSGFHCTPLGHETAGTTGTGAVRASPGYFTTDKEIESFIRAIEEIAVAFRK